MSRSHGLLVVRAWTGGLGAPPFAARVWSTPDVGSAEAAMDVVTSPEAVVAAVRRWLADVLEGTDVAPEGIAVAPEGNAAAPEGTAGDPAAARPGDPADRPSG